MTNKICDGCETVAHCLKNVCISKPDIIAMARKAGIDHWWDSGNEHRETLQEHLERFASLVAAAAKVEEREACAKVREKRSDPLGYAKLTAEVCAADIRARAVGNRAYDRYEGETK